MLDMDFFWNHGLDASGWGVTLHGFLPKGCCFLQPEKLREGAHATVKMLKKELSHQREADLVFCFFLEDVLSQN